MKRLIRTFFRLLGGLVAILIVVSAIFYGYRPKLERVPVPPPKPISGAAMFYEEAFAAMPELSGEEMKLFDQSKPLDEDVAQSLIQKWETPLGLLAKGAAMGSCEWEGIPFSGATNPSRERRHGARPTAFAQRRKSPSRRRPPHGAPILPPPGRPRDRDC